LDNRGYIKYSESFKIQVVSELSAGKYQSTREASRAYGIKGRETVSNWCRQYGGDCFLRKQIKVYGMKERDELKELKKEVQELKAAMADAYMEKLLEESFLEIACERIGVDVSDFKKKHGTTLSNIRKGRIRK
jgi:transposase-like protein